MGITTFSGPVRSDNGFQVYDGSEWVPAAGADNTGIRLQDYANVVNFTRVGEIVSVYLPSTNPSAFSINFTYSGAAAEITPIESSTYFKGYYVNPDTGGNVIVSSIGRFINVVGSAGFDYWLNFMYVGVDLANFSTRREIMVSGKGYNLQFLNS